MKTIIRFHQELTGRGAMCYLQLPFQLVSTTPATTNDNKTSLPGECMLLGLNNRFRLSDGVWECLQKKSTKVYNGYSDGSCECETEGKNVEWVFLNVRSTDHNGCPNGCSYSCSDGFKRLPGLQHHTVKLTVSNRVNEVLQCGDNLEFQRVVGRNALNNKDVLGLAHLFSLITHTTENCFHNDK